MTKVEFNPDLKVNVVYEIVGPFIKRTQYDGRNYSNGVIAVTKKSYTKKQKGLFAEDFVKDVTKERLKTGGIARFVLQNKSQLDEFDHLFSLDIRELIVMSQMDFVKKSMVKRNNLHKRVVVTDDMTRVLKYKRS